MRSSGDLAPRGGLLTLTAACLTAACLTLAGCPADFPDELLYVDAAAIPDSASDGAGQQHDLIASDQATGEASVDGPAPDVSADQGSSTPCSKHAACPSEVCRLAGSCAGASDVSYVDGPGCTGGKGSGSYSDPFCTIGPALSAPARYVLIRKGVYPEALAISSDRELYGDPGVTIQPGGCSGLTVSGGATVVLAGITVSGGQISVSGAGSAATISRCTVGASGCIGVSASSDTTVSVSRSLITGNTGGGLQLIDGAFSVVNCYIVKNGSAQSAFGGARLKMKGALTFFNNTLADNKASGASDKEAGAVRCDGGGVKLFNSILWGNFTNSLGADYSPTCSPQYCALGCAGTPPSTNLKVSPSFAGTGSGAAGYHLQKTSPLKDQGTATGAPATDYDGDKRDGKPDIGADEIN